MSPILPITTTPTALPALPSVLAAPASDLVSTRLTSVAPVAPLSSVQVNNDLQGSVPVVAPAANEQENAVQTDGASVAQSGSLSASGPSAPFLAQLISQNDAVQEDDEVALQASFARFAPALQYNTFVSYGIVKYRPSNAGLPTAYAPVAAASDYQAYSTTQTRNQSNLSSALSHSVVG